MNLPSRVCLAAAILLLAPGGLSGQTASATRDARRPPVFGPAFQLVFFSVLDGCFQDGLSDADVDQFLLRAKPNGGYEHFVLNCPICSATVRALETYRARPDSHLKIGGKLAFGEGLTAQMHARLYSADVKERLSAIHDLEQNWVDRHVASLRLDPQETAQTQKELKDARDDGTRLLQAFVKQGQLDDCAPAYHEGDECAVCNAAVGMTLKLAPGAPGN